MERMADSCHLGSILQWKCAKNKPGASTILLGGLPCLQVHAIACGAMCIMGLLVLLRKRAFVLLLMIAVFVPYVQDVIAVIGIADILFLLRDK